MTKEIDDKVDNKVKEYLDRAHSVIDRYYYRGFKDYDDLNSSYQSNIIRVAELIQKEEHFREQNKVNLNIRNDLTPGQIKEVKDIIDSRPITRNTEPIDLGETEDNASLDEYLGETVKIVDPEHFECSVTGEVVGLVLQRKELVIDIGSNLIYIKPHQVEVVT